MAKFRKKPVVIEAFQMTTERRWDNKDWPEWLNRAWNAEPGATGALWIDPTDPDRARLIVGTLESANLVSWNDWIIQGVKGELYPCKPDIFEATYELYDPHAVLGDFNAGFRAGLREARNPSMN